MPKKEVMDMFGRRLTSLEPKAPGYYLAGADVSYRFEFASNALYSVSKSPGVKALIAKTHMSRPGELVQLVDQLALDHPDSSISKAQLAYIKLCKYREQAIPVLVQFSDDRRTSFCPGDVRGPYTVGSMCKQCLSETIEPSYAVDHYFKNVTRDGPEGSTVTRPVFLGDLKKWWASRQQWTLEEMQLEAVEWFIHAEKSAGFSTPKQKESILGELENIRNDLLKVARSRHDYIWQHRQLSKGRVIEMCRHYLKKQELDLSTYRIGSAIFVPSTSDWRVYLTPIKEFSNSTSSPVWMITISDTSGEIQRTYAY